MNESSDPVRSSEADSSRQSIDIVRDFFELAPIKYSETVSTDPLARLVQDWKSGKVDQPAGEPDAVFQFGDKLILGYEAASLGVNVKFVFEEGKLVEVGP